MHCQKLIFGISLLKYAVGDILQDIFLSPSSLGLSLQGDLHSAPAVTFPDPNYFDFIITAIDLPLTIQIPSSVEEGGILPFSIQKSIKANRSDIHQNSSSPGIQKYSQPFYLLNYHLCHCIRLSTTPPFPVASISSHRQQLYEHNPKAFWGKCK